jgi:nucleotide-binding universal stress UspA family protein
VVVATDFSRGAARAVGRAALLPVDAAASFTLVHVLPESLPATLGGTVRERAGGALEDLAAGLRRDVARSGRGPLAIECELLAGTAYEAIVRHARTRGADLVVVGRHGSRGVREAPVGATAERVVRKTDAAVLLVSGEPEGPYRRPLVALDLSDTSRRATDLALALLPDEAPELALVHAYTVAFEAWLPEAALEEHRHEHRDHAERRAREFAAQHAERGVAFRVAVRDGDPRVVVLSQAVHDRSDLVVIGTHAREGVSHALLGTVAEWVIRAAPCDVAITRPPRFSFEMP